MLNLDEKQVPHAILSSSIESPTQQEASKLYDAGLNVFPQPLGQKAGYPWKKLQFTRLHRTHHTYGIHALFAGQCNLAVMCGRTSNNLFVIDCETPESFQQNIVEMQKRELPLWAVETARGGHIYLFSQLGEVKSIAPGSLPNIEIRGKGYVIAPPSIHPTGAIYQWFSREGNSPPTIELDTINWLKDANTNKIKLKLINQRHPKPISINSPTKLLSKTTRDYLTSGTTIPEGNRNNRLFRAACDIAGNNFSYQNASTILTSIARSSGLKNHEISRAIQNAYNKPRTPSLPSTSAPKPTTWQRAAHYGTTTVWKGRTGNADRAVFMVLVERARLSGNNNNTFRASVREVAVLARISRETAHKALKRLQNHNPSLIKYAGRDRTSQASLWRFTTEIEKHKYTTNDTPGNWDTIKNGLSDSVLVYGSTDAVERGALGRSGMRVYRVLLASDEPMLPKSIMSLSGMTRGQVEYGLRKLRDYDLLIREAAGWKAVVASDEQLDDSVARTAGTLGKGAQRAQRYAAERALFAGRDVFMARFGKRRRSRRVQIAKQSDTIDVVSGRNFVNNHDDLPPGCLVWKCPNCGQLYFGDTPPDMCAFCADLTTWQCVKMLE